MSAVNVYVPIGVAMLAVDPRSGVVGTPQGDGKVLIDYEGNRFKAANIVTFADRVQVAYGRHNTHYPTVARMLRNESEVELVATFDPQAGRVYTLGGTHELMSLLSWLEIPVPPLGEDVLSEELLRELACTSSGRFVP